MLSRRVTLIACAGLFACAGCVPSDPGGASAGVRVDGGVFTLLIAVCPGELVESAAVRAFAEEPKLWAGQDFKGAGGIVRLAADSWTRAEGSYVGVEAVSISVTTSERNYAAALDGPEEVAKAANLEEGQYLVDETVMTRDEYDQYIDRAVPCPGS